MRYDAEQNPAFQQLIPYVLLLSYNNDLFYISKRISGEKRLRGQFSLGFGGHINPSDGYRNVIYNAMMRELREEVKIKMVGEPCFIGYVRDLTSNTSEHLGFVYTVRVRSASIKEKTVHKGSWADLSKLVDDYFMFETWGKHLIDHFYKIFSRKPGYFSTGSMSKQQ